MINRLIALIVAAVCLCDTAWSLTPEAGAAFVRVVDVGAGLCCVIKIPGGHNIVYDAGNFEDSGRTAFAAVRRLIPPAETIDLLILSHSDSDHLAATKAICDAYKVQRIVHPGLRRDTDTWRSSDAAIADEKRTDGAEVLNLAETALAPGTRFRIGQATATLVCGFHLPPAEFGRLNESERNNAGSIILRLVFRGRSILFCGDAVGRHIGDADSSILAEEAFMVANRSRVPIESDIIVAPHHGADNGSSTPFLNAVKPKCAIFSAGHKFEHPRKSTVQRYLALGLTPRDIYRTDRGDDEGPNEWDGERVTGTRDRSGDDDVDVLIRRTGRIIVSYAGP